jgi:hypothetical protein
MPGPAGIGIGHPVVADSGWYQHAEFGGDMALVVASGQGDGTRVYGHEIDRLTVHHGALAYSVKAILPYTVTIASGGHMVIASGIVQHREVGEGWGTYLSQGLGLAILQANDDGSAIEDVAQVDIDLSGAKQFIRSAFTPQIIGSGIALLGPIVYDFGGFDRRPVL